MGEKSPHDQFDAIMGSLDRAEICELVGRYLLSLLAETYGQNIGRYGDDQLDRKDKKKINAKSSRRFLKSRAKPTQLSSISWTKRLTSKVANTIRTQGKEISHYMCTRKRLSSEISSDTECL